MKVFTVLAHPEPKSFNGALAALENYAERLAQLKSEEPYLVGQY